MFKTWYKSSTLPHLQPSTGFFFIFFFSREKGAYTTATQTLLVRDRITIMFWMVQQDPSTTLQERTVIRCDYMFDPHQSRRSSLLGWVPGPFLHCVRREEALRSTSQPLQGLQESSLLCFLLIQQTLQIRPLIL